MPQPRLGAALLPPLFFILAGWCFTGAPSAGLLERVDASAKTYYTRATKQAAYLRVFAERIDRVVSTAEDIEIPLPTVARLSVGKLLDPIAEANAQLQHQLRGTRDDLSELRRLQPRVAKLSLICAGGLLVIAALLWAIRSDAPWLSFTRRLFTGAAVFALGARLLLPSAALASQQLDERFFADKIEAATARLRPIEDIKASDRPLRYAHSSSTAEGAGWLRVPMQHLERATKLYDELETKLVLLKQLWSLLWEHWRAAIEGLSELSMLLSAARLFRGLVLPLFMLFSLALLVFKLILWPTLPKTTPYEIPLILFFSVWCLVGGPSGGLVPDLDARADQHYAASKELTIRAYLLTARIGSFTSLAKHSELSIAGPHAPKIRAFATDLDAADVQLTRAMRELGVGLTTLGSLHSLLSGLGMIVIGGLLLIAAAQALIAALRRPAEKRGCWFLRTALVLLVARLVLPAAAVATQLLDDSTSESELELAMAPVHELAEVEREAIGDAEPQSRPRDTVSPQAGSSRPLFAEQIPETALAIIDKFSALYDMADMVWDHRREYAAVMNKLSALFNQSFLYYVLGLPLIMLLGVVLGMSMLFRFLRGF